METYHSSVGTWSVRSNGMLIILVDEGLGEYYRERFNLTYRTRGIKLMKCKWGPHITVIREGEEQLKEKIIQYDGKPVSFEYSHEAEGNSFHFWLPVTCQTAVEVRKSLGLPPVARYPLHLTFGVTTEKFHGTDKEKSDFDFSSP